MACGKNAVDTGNYIYRSTVNPTSDPTFSEFRNNLVFDLWRSEYPGSDPRSRMYPKYGYQNAPMFCSNEDGALGTYTFNVPTDLEKGSYRRYNVGIIL